MRIVKYIFFTFAISEIIFICSFWDKNFKGLDCAKDRLLQVDRVEITSDRSSTSQIFFKTGYIEYLAIFTRKRLCWDFFLTLIWVGFLGVRFEVQGVGVKLPPPPCSFRKYTFQCLGPLNFADASIFLQKNQRFLSEKVPLLKAIV